MFNSESETLKASVNCRVLLEHDGWRLDKRESSRGAVKYRRGAGEIIIVIHDDRGWFDPCSEAKGDVFDLARHLRGGGFPDAVAALRPLAGLSPSPQPWLRPPAKPAGSLAERWRRRRRPAPGSPAWRYLTRDRALPEQIAQDALEFDLLREGPFGSLWAAHRDDAGRLTGWECRGPRWRGFATGGTKVLFRLGRPEALRFCVTEAAIDALSLAALERSPSRSAYLSTGGGWGPATAEAVAGLLRTPGSELIAATDNDAQGERFAARLAAAAGEAGAPCRRLRPRGADWNDDLRRRRR